MRSFQKAGSDRVKQLKYSSLIITVLYLFLFFYPSFASAHAYILKSTPYENEIIQEAPKKVSIEFDEKIQTSFHSIEVFDSSGKRVDQKNGGVNAENPSIIECNLDKNLPNGTYSIQWRVVSSDGHPVQGVIPFQIGNGGAQDSSNDHESKGYSPKFDLIIIRWLQYMSNACFLGILFFSLFVLRKELLNDTWVFTILSKMAKLSIMILALSIILSLPLQATIESGLSWGKVLSVEVFSDILENTLFGEMWILQICCLFFVFVATYFVHKTNFKPLWIWISFVLGIGLILSKTFTSHATSSTNVYLTIPLDFIHLLSASIWIGSIVTLVALIPLSRKTDTKTLYFDTIHRFSKWGILFVLLLTITGFCSSISFVPNLRSLLFTDYGRVLLGKIFLLMIMMVFAAVNFVKGKRNRETGLTSSLWGELLLGISILILSVLLTNLPTAMASPGPFKETNKDKQGSSITFEATPNVIGENDFVLSLKNKKGQPMKGIEQVTLTFTSLEMDMGDDTKTLTKVKDGKYKGQGMNFNMAGRWNVHVHVLTKDLETIDTDFKVRVGSQ
ncbi:copper resistance protein CopC [Neobacillus drentensis]|uniref:copper resistance CopC/CopD family protein n=1 Tax=Neobacillus drentensis TaxID=220684 RepID=UPI001F421A4B|nr:copper resistance protein CopC [Neobacillus drentensis]ULT59274.1 copper resistance protein CopC [Neobacillus drentensis]